MMQVYTLPCKESDIDYRSTLLTEDRSSLLHKAGGVIHVENMDEISFTESDPILNSWTMFEGTSSVSLLEVV